MEVSREREKGQSPVVVSLPLQGRAGPGKQLEGEGLWEAEENFSVTESVVGEVHKGEPVHREVKGQLPG